ncbi:MAG: hypothetical protein HN736_14730 [Anaerolineae bacterium]|jgi:hypothetical protein|nr:hypothetical protein [Anaerolineae bacterium]MBT4309278.1 hypothetical protein [Anaerolineae bacterium]MBT4458491.1 hypothetical protein [Anaerolineae bacterium]MBT4843512.1 hypothetical protein [Anaerolineae bacterium]MBT6062740.1 hypothetical protein [Anaerolineae bacterium]
MLQSKLSRHTLAFGIIVIASLLLYPVAEGGKTPLIYLLLILIVFAAFITLKKE